MLSSGVLYGTYNAVQEYSTLWKLVDIQKNTIRNKDALIKTLEDTNKLSKEILNTKENRIRRLERDK